MARILCFGLPGTGKSTFVKSKPVSQQMHLDLGHNAFKSEEQREKFYRKAVTHTTYELGVISHLSWYYDTYPEYFDVKEVLKYDILVVFAVPSDTLLRDFVVPRVYRRDGDSEFARLYARSYSKWRQDWLKIIQRWRSILGKKRVKVIDLYDEFKA